jgi:putative transposase
MVCNGFEITRDAYYKKRARSTKKDIIKSKVLNLAIEHRMELPREGCKKLYKAMEHDLKSLEIKFGRDKLFDLLRENNLLIRRRKKFVHTTNSHHRFHKYESLLKNFTPTGPNQVWVSDITYIRKIRGFCFLEKNKIRISMTEENHCYENAIAERVNGILKDEFFLDEYFKTIQSAKEACDYAINLYNNKRLHLSLNYKTPQMVHQNVA